MHINTSLVNKTSSCRQTSQYLLLGLLIFSLFFLYRETLIYLFDHWSQLQNGEYAHGFVVLAIIVYMLYQKLPILQTVQAQPQPLVIVFVLAFSLCWMIGILLGIRVVESSSYYWLFPCTVFVLGGRSYMRLLWFPLLYLLVALPVWEVFLPYLQKIATVLSYHITRLAGTEVIREDAYLIVRSGKFLVADGCSGLRYLLAAMTFGGFYIYLEGLTRSRALGFFSLVVLAAILSNALRISAVVYMGDRTQMQHPWVHDHLMLGWYIFIAMLIPVFWLGSKFCAAQDRVDASQQRQDAEPRSAEASSQPSVDNRLSIVILLLLIIAVASGPFLKTYLLAKIPQTVAPTFQLLAPTDLRHWQAARYAESVMVESHFEGADAILEQIYSNTQGEQARLYIASYAFQKQDKELINVKNHLYNEEYWQAISERVITPAGATMPVRELLLKTNNGDKKLLWTWYRIAGKTTVKKLSTKLLDLSALVSGKTGTSVVTLSVDLDTDVDQVRQRMGQFYQALVEPINVQLDGLKNEHVPAAHSVE